MLNPMSPQTVRMEAFTHCESFKEQSPPNLSMHCGLMLCSGKKPDVVRHFGLKLLEDTIKLRWNEMPPDQKLFMKENAMRLMESGTSDLITEARHIKDALSRIVVEIIKREWPQQWPNLLLELETLCSKGDTQTELVMLVMLRIVEDVAVLQTLEQNQRRKEIYQGLVSQMGTIFCFLLTLLERHYQAYLSSTAEDVKLRHSKVCQSVLATFNAFVEWVPMLHIMANEHYLVRCLCHLLKDERMQLHAAECLVTIVSWKAGKLQDRAQLLILFKTEMMAPIFQAVENAERNSHEEHHYLFLKRLVQILVELGGQVCYVWSNGSEYKMPPENFDVYLNALLAFTRHDSHVVNNFSNELWAKFLRQPDISRDDLFRSFLPKWIEVAMKKAIKVGFPSQNSHPSCDYSRLDFECDDEFSVFFSKYRVILFEIIKLISAMSPILPYHFTDGWLRSVLTGPHNFGKGNSVCTQESPIYLELEAIQLILDAALSRLKDPDELQPILAPASELLKLCLDFRTQDPCLTSVILSCISSLFVVVTVTPAALMPTMNRIFESIKFGSQNQAAVMNGGLNVSPPTMPHEIKLLRRHGCCLLVKIGYKYPKTLLPIFEHLRSTIVGEFHRGYLHKMEYVTLVEALVLVSNEFSNFNVQSSFLKTICEPVVAELNTLIPILSNADRLMRYIGLVLDGDVETCQNQRSKLSYCLQFLLAISRRSACPTSDITKCRQGGFIYTAAGFDGQKNVLALQNPAGHVGCAVLEVIFTYAKTLNDLWSPTSLAQLKPETVKALDLLESEKKSLIGINLNQRSTSVAPNEETENTQTGDDSGNGEISSGVNVPPSSKSELQRLQSFIFEQYENVYHFLSLACVAFGHEFYKQQNLANAISSTVFQGFLHIPDYRLRSVVRTFLKSLVNKCPQQYFATVIAPLLHQLMPYMQHRLNDKWNRVVSFRESENFDEDNTDSQEVLEDVICRQLTREYLDLVKAALTSGGGSDLKHDDTKVYASSENLSKSAGEGSGSYNLTLSNLGKMIVQNDASLQHVMTTLLEALVWPDSPSSVRASNLLEIVLPVIASHETLPSEEAARIFYTILRALHLMGSNEPNYIALMQLAVLAYELLRARHPIIAEVLAQIPGCSMEDVKRFDDHVLQVIHGKENGGKSGGKIVGDRTLKNMFKKLVVKLIGKDVAQMFKQEVIIKNLPTLMPAKPRHKTPSLEDSEHTELGITALFGQNGSSTTASTTTTPAATTTITSTPFTL